MTNSEVQASDQLEQDQQSWVLFTDKEKFGRPTQEESDANQTYTVTNSAKYTARYYATILETMEQVRKKPTGFASNDHYRRMGIPTPNQYAAFNKMYRVPETKTDYFETREKGIYNLARLPGTPLLLELLQNVSADPGIGKKLKEEKGIAFSCGSLWRKNLWLRGEVFEMLNKIHTDYDVPVSIYSNCRENEEYVCDLKKTIDFTYIADSRIMIHYQRIGKEYILMDFPHSELIYLRLYMLLTRSDLDDLGRKKVKFLKFFDTLIEDALKPKFKFGFKK